MLWWIVNITAGHGIIISLFSISTPDTFLSLSSSSSTVPFSFYTFTYDSLSLLAHWFEFTFPANRYRHTVAVFWQHWIDFRERNREERGWVGWRRQWPQSWRFSHRRRRVTSWWPTRRRSCSFFTRSPTARTSTFWSSPRGGVLKSWRCMCGTPWPARLCSTRTATRRMSARCTSCSSSWAFTSESICWGKFWNSILFSFVWCLNILFLGELLGFCWELVHFFELSQGDFAWSFMQPLILVKFDLFLGYWASITVSNFCFCALFSFKLYTIN